MQDNRIWDDIIIRIEHGQTDDELDTEGMNLTLLDAIETAKERVIETWYNFAEEDAASAGFPYYGIAIELNMKSGSDNTLTCHSQRLWWEGAEMSSTLFGEWQVDNGAMVYSITA